MIHRKPARHFAQPLAKRLDRRTFTRAAGVGLIAAPFLRLLRSESAMAAPGSAKRLVIMVTGGTHVLDWKMTGSTEDNIVTNGWNDGLDRVKDKIAVIEGLNAGAGGHGSYVTLLCNKFFWDGDSIDRVVSDHLVANGASGAIPSLLLGSDVEDSLSDFRHGGGIPPVQSPTAALDLVFGDFDPNASVDEAALAVTLAKKQSMLDAVRGELNELHGMLGTEERPKLEAHLESLRQYEERLSADSPSGDGCELPMIADSTDPITVAKSHMLLARATLACDISRVVGVMWGSHNRFGINIPEAGVVEDLHSLHHNLGNKHAEMGAWESYSSHQFADFVELLEGTPDPESDGSLLDSTLVVWARNMGDGVTHSGADCRLVMAGGPNIINSTPNGRYINAGGVYKSGLATVAHAMGQTDPSVVDGNMPIAGVLA